MSIFSKCKSVFLQKKVLFVMAMLVSQILYFPLIIYAQEDEGAAEAIGEDADTQKNPSEEESADKGIIFEKEICHKHSGNRSGGGCYTEKREEKITQKVPCRGTMVYWPATDSTSCNRCGAGYSGDASGRECWTTTEKQVTNTYYERGCKKEESSVIGKLCLKQSATDWVKSLTLTGSYQTAGEMKVNSKPYIWNGGSAVENPVYEVNSSGAYSLRLNADTNANTEVAVIRVHVKNVDVTAPVIKGYSKEPDMDWTKEGVLVNLTEAVDLQPDGSEGCGLHELPYSYDNGKTWTAESSHRYSENGTFSVLVRDKLENTSACAISFQNIDTTPPTLQSMEYDHTKNILSTGLTVSASDLQPDGSEGCGLHELPYSYDGGKTWTAENTHEITKNGILAIAIRDKLENVREIEERIANIDCSGPRIICKMKPSSWTKRDVSLYLSAKDINEDGSDGIGLADTWYSLDGGASWSNKEEVVFEKNTNLTVIARDCHDNRTTEKIKINQIDKDLPWVSLKMEILGNGPDRKVKLQAYAGDDYSGLHEEGYSWNKGCSYSSNSSLIVTENGRYQVTVRDKAGNVNYEQIEVDVFPILFPMAPVISESAEPEEAEESHTEEWEREEAEVILEKRIAAAEKIPVQTLPAEDIGGDSLWKTGLFFLLLTVLVFLALLFLILLLMGTVRVFAKDTSGKLRFLGICKIGKKAEGYMVKVPLSMVEQAMTKQFCFKVSGIFADRHRGEELFFLFPEGVCVTLTIERTMEIE